MGLKRCSACRQVKSTTEFQRKYRNPDMCQSFCRVCQNAYVAARQRALRDLAAAHPEQYEQMVAHHRNLMGLDKEKT